MRYYPVAFKLKGKTALVIGAGKIAEHKIASLRKSPAYIKVIAPEATRGIHRLAAGGALRWFKRGVLSKDLSGVDFIIAATDDDAVNRKVSLWAKRRGIPVNVVDNPSLSTFISPAIFRARKAIVAVYTDGRDPVLSRDLKNFIRENWDAFVSYRNRL